MNIHGSRWQRIRALVLMQELWCVGYPAGYHGQLRVRTNSVDHIVPRWRGGTEERSNLRGLCRGCNSRKAVLEEGARGRGDFFRRRVPAQRQIGRAHV